MKHTKKHTIQMTQNCGQLTNKLEINIAKC